MSMKYRRILENCIELDKSYTVDDITISVFIFGSYAKKNARKILTEKKWEWIWVAPLVDFLNVPGCSQNWVEMKIKNCEYLDHLFLSNLTIHSSIPDNIRVGVLRFVDELKDKLLGEKV